MQATDSLEFRCVLVSDFNTANLASYLENNASVPAVRVDPTPYGEPIQTLLRLSDTAPNVDCCVVWTQPESVIRGFSDGVSSGHFLPERILQDVDEFGDLVCRAARRMRCVFVPLWAIPTSRRGAGALEMKERGLHNTLMRMNLRLADRLSKCANVHVMNTPQWIAASGQRAFNPKLWYLSKIPFGNQVFIEAVLDIKATLNGLHGKAKRLLLLDLDNTLWGGVVGDVGWESIRLGGHDAEGEAFLDFQKALKAMTHRGLLLGIVSKNDEALAMKAIESHPEMQLRPRDFAGWRINWGDKAENIVDLAIELNLGLDSAVFIDDNPAERARVREALPNVFVPDWPENCMLYRSTLESLRCFDVPTRSQEDAARTGMYVSERERRRLRSSVPSLEAWLQSLEINVRVEAMDDANVMRIVQILNKVNQMNLATRRMAQDEFSAWASEPHRAVFAFRVSDRLGDSGLVGLLSMEEEQDDSICIADFVLSCRVFGRKIEDAMVHKAAAYGRRRGKRSLIARYRPTPKSRPCLTMLEQLFEPHGEHLFVRDLDGGCSLPGVIQYVDHSDESSKS